MKLNFFFWFSAFLSVFHPGSDGRPAGAAPGHQLLLRLKEALPLGGGDSSSSSSEMKRVLLQLGPEKMRRSEEPPLSLDLTFHLLREVLEMARAEQLAQQADSNRRMMDSYGK
ncbi:corticoliberin-like [Fundulus heteroclitus]|uniref:corticoliberin-like n=1 Tax=Fundulus heteroclitus TaxID=8078 RepID=UPI000B365D73|nr:corticoliberin-like [Fundulus heteroclitus]